jgi:Transposase zinc-binding domain
MITINDIFRLYGPAYRAQYGDRMLPSHRAAMTALEAWRTEAFGGHVYPCPSCATTCYSYHSCKKRAASRSALTLISRSPMISGWERRETLTRYPYVYVVCVSSKELKRHRNS